MEPNNNKKYPEGYFVRMWLGIGLAISPVIGILLSISTKNYGLIGIGPAIGVAFGLSIGQAIENKHKKEGKIRPLTEEEKKRREIALIPGIVLLTLGVIIFLLLFFFNY